MDISCDAAIVFAERPAELAEELVAKNADGIYPLKLEMTFYNLFRGSSSINK